MAMDRNGDGPPLRREDTKARPTGRDELRATPFTDDVFDDDYYGRRRSSAKGGRTVSLVVGVVLGLAIVGGVGWYALKDGGMSLVPGEPQTVQADPNPYKIKPENPGGLQVENQDKLVYDRVAKGNAPNRVENLLPPAEEPKAPPQKPKTEPAKPQVAAEDKKALEDIVKATAEAPKPAAAPPAPEPPKQVAEAPKPEASKADPLAAAVAAAAPGKTSATGPIVTDSKPVEAAPAQPPVQTAAVTPAAPTPAAAGSGSFQIQLVSVPSEEAANSEWTRLNRKHKDLFANLSPAVTKADLGDRGTFYRLRAGPLADKAAADALCAALAAEKTGCVVVKP
jgi:hypothetical protein